MFSVDCLGAQKVPVCRLGGENSHKRGPLVSLCGRFLRACVESGHRCALILGSFFKILGEVKWTKETSGRGDWSFVGGPEDWWQHSTKPTGSADCTPHGASSVECVSWLHVAVVTAITRTSLPVMSSMKTVRVGQGGVARKTSEWMGDF